MTGERIQRARRLRGLSLEALAQCMGDISRQALSKFEKGVAVPNSARLFQLARVLAVKPEYFFLSPDTVELALEQCVDAADIRIQQVAAGWLPVRGLEEAEAAAESLREQWCLGKDAIADMTGLFEEHGIKIVMLDGVEQFDGACVATRDKAHVMVALNRCARVTAQRFTAAHELRHRAISFSDEMLAKRGYGVSLVYRGLAGDDDFAFAAWSCGASESDVPERGPLVWRVLVVEQMHASVSRSCSCSRDSIAILPWRIGRAICSRRSTNGLC